MSENSPRFGAFRATRAPGRLRHITNRTWQNMGASRGGTIGRRRAFGGPTATAVTVNNNRPSSAWRDDKSWLLFGGARGGGPQA